MSILLLMGAILLLAVGIVAVKHEKDPRGTFIGACIFITGGLMMFHYLH